MIATLIIDDERQARKIIRNYLKRFAPQCEVVGEAEGVSDAYEKIRHLKPELVFLDVRMQDGTGFDLLGLLEDIPFQVIFVTAYDAYALRAFRFNAVDYLVKPISPREFKEAVERVSSQKHPTPGLQEFVQQHRPVRRIALKTLDSIHMVAVEDIVRLRSDNSYTTVYLRDGRSILVSRSIKHFHSILPKAHFARTHQSHLVNLYYVDRFERSTMTLYLTGQEEVPVATRRKEAVLSLLERMQ